MSGTMARADVIADLKRSLHDSASVFDAVNTGDFGRFLDLALPDMARKRPRTLVGEVQLVAGTPRYSLASYPDFCGYKTYLWGAERLADSCYPKPWEPGYPGAIPRISASNDGAVWWLDFDPAPSWQHLGALGSVCKFYYFGAHTVAADAVDTTVQPMDRGLLLLRCQVEAMRELTIRNVNKPVQVRDGLSGTPRNSTPAALHETLLKIFQEAR